MNRTSWLGCVFIVAGLGTLALPSRAQIAPDETLGQERSQVNPLNPSTDVIQGGARRGINLFHSFQDFNVELGRSVYFISPNLEIQNILARVTGSNPSQILGLLGTAVLTNNRIGVSNANLFLINPNGIVFGKDATLDVDRSFLATTANGIQFGDRGTFSASRPKGVTDVLSIDPSAFLFNKLPIQDISVQSRVPLPNGNFGLRVPNSQNLILLGGNVTMDGGGLNAFGGRVEIGAVSGIGTVGVNALNGLQLSPDSVTRSNISLNNGSRINVRASGKGDIALYAQDLSVSEGSRILAGLSSSDNPNAQAGDIIINATGRLVLSGSSGSFISNALPSGESIGKAGNIRITADSVSIAQGAQIFTGINSNGIAGNIVINARDIDLEGVDPNSKISSNISSLIQAQGRGRTGNVEIETDRLTIRNGARVQTGILSGQGTAGTVQITAKDIVLQGEGIESDSASGIFSRIEVDASGQVGGINVVTDTLTASGGALLSASTDGQGNAGNIEIKARKVVFDGVGTFKQSLDSQQSSGIYSAIKENGQGTGGEIILTTDTLSITQGATIFASTLNKGDAGNIRIVAKDAASLDGQDPDGFSSGIYSRVDPRAIGRGGRISLSAKQLSITNGAILTTTSGGKGDAGDININAANARFEGESQLNIPGTPLKQTSGVFSSVRDTGVGKAGSIQLSTQLLSLNRAAGVVVSNLSESGNAGDLTIRANKIILDQQSFFTGEAKGGTGGNIVLTVTDILLLRRGSSISTTAGLDGKGGDGGSITISAPFLVAIPQENSDITANAFQGNGGKVTLNLERGILGLAARAQPTQLSDITASSAQGATGVVILNAPSTDSIQNSLKQLTQDVIDTNTLLANSCIIRRNQSTGTFFVTGSGGLARRPGDAPISPYATGEVRSTSPSTSWKLGDPVVEPQGVYQLQNGQLVMSRECSN